MMSHDSARFQATMARLSITFGKELSPGLIEIYWDALKPLAIEQFEAGSKSWIRHGKHFPKPAEILERFREMSQAAPPAAAPVLSAPDPKWLRQVNSLFLKYLFCRRITEGFTGDMNLLVRRKVCRELAEVFAEMEFERDPEATPAEMRRRFDPMMARIADLREAA